MGIEWVLGGHDMAPDGQGKDNSEETAQKLRDYMLMIDMCIDQQYGADTEAIRRILDKALKL